MVAIRQEKLHSFWRSNFVSCERVARSNLKSKMWRWEDVKVRRCKDVKMRRCEDVKMWRWEDVKMRRCEVRRCEDEKMWRWEGVKMRRWDTDPHYWKNPALRRAREKLARWREQMKILASTTSRKPQNIPKTSSTRLCYKQHVPNNLNFCICRLPGQLGNVGCQMPLLSWLPMRPPGHRIFLHVKSDSLISSGKKLCHGALPVVPGGFKIKVFHVQFFLWCASRE